MPRTKESAASNAINGLPRRCGTCASRRCPAHCVFDGTSKVARPMTPDQDHRSLGVDVAINIIPDPDWDEERLAAATRKLFGRVLVGDAIHDAVAIDSLGKTPIVDQVGEPCLTQTARQCAVEILDQGKVEWHVDAGCHRELTQADK